MRKITHKHRPMLRWIRILMDRLRDLLPQPCLLGEPLAPKPADRMPSNLDKTLVAVYLCDAMRNHIGLLAKTQGVFKYHLPLEHAVFGLAEAYFPDIA
jgi:hypothetical protein